MAVVLFQFIRQGQGPKRGAAQLLAAAGLTLSIHHSQIWQGSRGLIVEFSHVIAVEHSFELANS